MGEAVVSCGCSVRLLAVAAPAFARACIYYLGMYATPDWYALATKVHRF